MSQTWDIDQIIPASTSPATDIQRIIDGFNALRSNFSGAAEPAVADQVAYMFWADTTTGLLKIRNAANSAWVTIGTLASENLGLLPLTGGTLNGPTVLSMSSSSDALRITQTGSGNALVVEDSTNPDSTPVIIDAAGLVVIGHTQTLPMSSGINPRLQIHATTLSSGAYAAIVNWAANTTPATFTLGKVRSGVIDTHGLVASGDVAGRHQFEVSDGADIYSVAKIDVTMDGTTGTADLPTRMGFFTTADGASSPTERLRIDSTGLVTVYSGQIAFPATANPSSDANTLDDYEEGTWTPDVGGTATYTSQTGVYTKIGRLVTVHCTLNINAIGTGSATTISGLPFAVSGSITVNGAVYWSSGAVSPVYVVAQAASGGTTVALQGITAAGASLSSLSLMGSGTIIRFTLTYPI